jgi:elongator complex protein 1
MPRGNLEAIVPRILLLDTLRALLDRYTCHASMFILMTCRHDYKTALLMMRKHRIDMNLLYDHNPAAFLEHLESFVTQVNNPELLNLFLSSLRYPSSV